MASAIIASNDINTIKLLGKILMKRNWGILVTNLESERFLKMVDRDTTLLFIDFDRPDYMSFSLIKDIKERNSNLLLVLLADEFSLEMRKRIAETSVFYCAVKPLDSLEMEQIIQAVEHLFQEEKFLENTIDWDLCLDNF